jgi:hypothetical protein
LGHAGAAFLGGTVRTGGRHDKKIPRGRTCGARLCYPR